MLLLERNRSLQSESAALRIANNELSGKVFLELNLRRSPTLCPQTLHYNDDVRQKHQIWGISSFSLRILHYSFPVSVFPTFVAEIFLL